MATRYDVFAKIIEKAPCKQKDLGFSSPVYAHLKSLINMGYIRKSNDMYLPVKDTTTESVFKIIKYCLKSGIDYNIFFLKDFFNVFSTLNQTVPNLRPKKIKNNKQKLIIMEFLESNQFVLVKSKKPRRGTILAHNLIVSVYALNNQKVVFKERFLDYDKIKPLVQNIPKTTINPFDNKYFAYLTGSAQLEGSTISLGETVDLLTKEIYPAKNAKDIQMVKNLNEAMHFIIDNLNDELTPTHIKAVNEKVLFSLHRGAGKYKRTQNKIHGNPAFKTTPPHDVQIEVEKFCRFFNNISTRETCLEHIGEIHNYIQRIHPFSDGNSRTTRMLVNWMLLKHDFPLLILRIGSYDKYMSLTKLSPLRSDEKVRDFFLHLLLHEKNF